MERLLNICRIYVCKDGKCNKFENLKEYYKWINNTENENIIKNTVFQPVCGRSYTDFTDSVILLLRKNGGKIANE
jgi:hypothetical protein